MAALCRQIPQPRAQASMRLFLTTVLGLACLARASTHLRHTATPEQQWQDFKRAYNKVNARSASPHTWMPPMESRRMTKILL
jgi:hypothetical protein